MGRKSKSLTISKVSKVAAPKALTPNQQALIEGIHKKEMVVALGPAGTGKTFISAAFAAFFYDIGKSKKIVLTRPTIPTGKSIGFFPGDLDEKMEPWVRPFMEILEEHLTKGKVELMRKNGIIEVVPFEVIRGRTFNDAFVILDEAQNCTALEIKAFVTRHGDNCTTVINGDISQSDLNGSGNGLELIVSMIKKSPKLLESVALAEFTSEDIVRSGLCQIWVQEFEKLKGK